MSRSDDQAVFEEFARARLTALLRFATALVRDGREAEDLVQTALAKTWASWSRVRRQDDPEAYVRRVIANERIGRWRRARRFAALPRQRVLDAGAPTEPDDELAAALESLPPRQRAVVILRYCEDRSEAETATILGCSKGTVKSQASKALDKLRATLVATKTVEATHE